MNKMMKIQDYLKTANENEEIFRNILRDLKDKRIEKPLGDLIPEDLKTDLPLEELFEMYSAGKRYGIFTICNFTIPEKNCAILTFENVALMSGGGAELKYLIKEDNSIEYKGRGMLFRS